jgi:hypothetical protein
MKFNFDFQLKNLSGKDFDKVDSKTNSIIELHHAGMALANALWQYGGDKSLKFSTWSQTLYKKEAIELDQSDYDVLLAWIETYGLAENKPWNGWFVQNGVRAQILQSLKDQKEKFDKKK